MSMLLETARRIIRRVPEEPIKIKIGGAEIPFVNREGFYNIQPHEYNLQRAREQGFKPKTFEEMLAVVNPELVHNVVLFDTEPNGVFTGNHFRIVTRDEELMLQRCNPTGTYGYQDSLPFQPPWGYEMFTGMEICIFERYGKRITLEETEKAYKDEFESGDRLSPEGVTMVEYKVLWSTEKDSLQFSLEQPRIFR